MLDDGQQLARTTLVPRGGWPARRTASDGDMQDFLASRQIHHDEISECRLQRTQRPDRKRKGSTRGILTGGRCAADEQW